MGARALAARRAPRSRRRRAGFLGRLQAYRVRHMEYLVAAWGSTDSHRIPWPRARQLPLPPAQRACCASASAPVEVPAPTFETASPTPTPASAVKDTRDGLPAECAELVGNDELSALFGLPVDSVTVRTVIGAPSPSVGRLERLTCTYTMSGPVQRPRMSCCG